MMNWELAILQCIGNIGEGAMLPQIYRQIKDYIRLTERHLRGTKWGGRDAYQHQVRSHISNLCKAGELLRVGRGCYSLTEKGKKRIIFMSYDLDDFL